MAVFIGDGGGSRAQASGRFGVSVRCWCREARRRLETRNKSEPADCHSTASRALTEARTTQLLQANHRAPSDKRPVPTRHARDAIAMTCRLPGYHLLFADPRRSLAHTPRVSPKQSRTPGERAHTMLLVTCRISYDARRLD
jgi:hypothetical protein